MGRQVLAVVHVSDAVFQMISTLDVDEEAFEPTPANKRLQRTGISVALIDNLL